MEAVAGAYDLAACLTLLCLHVATRHEGCELPRLFAPRSSSRVAFYTHHLRFDLRPRYQLSPRSCHMQLVGDVASSAILLDVKVPATFPDQLLCFRDTVQGEWCCQWHHKSALGCSVPTQCCHFQEGNHNRTVKSMAPEFALSAEQDQVQRVYGAGKTYKHNMGAGSRSI